MSRYSPLPERCVGSGHNRTNGQINAILALFLAALWHGNAWSGIEIANGKVVVETGIGQVVFDRGVVTEITNALTQETYSLGSAKGELTGLLWRNAPAMIDEKTQVLCEKRKANEAVIFATLADGHQLTTTITVDAHTQDILIRQSGNAKRKGLYGIQWGIAGLDSVQLHTIVPGHSGLRLDQQCPVSEMLFTWPVGWEAQMVIAESERGGFAVWSQDTQMRFKALNWRRQRNQFVLAFQSHNYAPFDELTSVESVEWRLNFFKGDWRVPAKRYRDWMHETRRLVRLEDQTPAWVKDIRFLVIMGMDTKILDALKTHVRPEATLLYIPAWRRDGYDQNYPDYTADEKFADFVKYARALGYHVMPHMNYFGCHEWNPAYERFKAWHIRDPFTRELMYWVPPRMRTKKDEFIPWKFAYINPASKAWRDNLTERLLAAQMQYGFDAIHLDQTLAIYNDANGEIDGVHSVEGNILLHRQLREAMPQVALSGEGLNEITCIHEAFAQRHAPFAVDHNYGTWNDEFIACGHPISSYFLTPYTKIYGYLGQCNPSNRELFLAWKRAYENWGVIPTYPRPTQAQLTQPDELVKVVLHEAKIWVDDELTPDFESDWSPLTKFRMKGKHGVAAVFLKDDFGGSQLIRIADGRKSPIYTIIKGRQVVVGTGTVAGWCAYDRDKLFGLNPDGTYLYLDEPRDLRATHVEAAPEDTLIKVLIRDDKKFMVEFTPIPKTRTFDFIKRLNEAETGIVVDGKQERLEYGGSFRPGMISCANVQKRALFAHPPWQIKAKTTDLPRTFGRYTLALPADCRAFLEFAIGLSDGVNDRSDGVQFRVEVNGETIFDEVWAKSQWKQVSLPLDRWRGQQVTITFITTPGPNGNPIFDWSWWGEPCVRFELSPRRGDVRLVSPKAGAIIVSTDPNLKFSVQKREDGLYVYNLNLEMPGRVALLWEKPVPVTLPLNLAHAPFSCSFTVMDTPARPPLPHAGAAPGSGTSNGEKRNGLNVHPPDRGRTSVDYVLELPDKKPLTLDFAVALREGSKSESVIFIVEANGKELYRQQLTKPDGWHPAQVDLSVSAGKPVLLSLVVDADGPHYYDWATWADPVLR